MNRSMIDLWVGVFVVVGFAALIFLALKVGNLATFSTDDTYQVQAKFANIGGLKVRGPVKSAARGRDAAQRGASGAAIRRDDGPGTGGPRGFGPPGPRPPSSYGLADFFVETIGDAGRTAERV